MQTIHLFRALSVLTIVLVTASFLKPVSNNQQAPFTGKYWILESSTVVPAIDLNMDGKPDNDIRVMMEDCELDDGEMYKADGKLMKDQGRKKCDEDDEQVMESGTWTYDAAAKKITVHHYDTDKPQTHTLKELSGNKMVLTYIFKTSKGSSHTITAVLKAK
jgi:hypothetical protein